MEGKSSWLGLFSRPTIHLKFHVDWNSALDIFGGTQVKFTDLVAYNGTKAQMWFANDLSLCYQQGLEDDAKIERDLVKWSNLPHLGTLLVLLLPLRHHSIQKAYQVALLASIGVEIVDSILMRRILQNLALIIYQHNYESCSICRSPRNEWHIWKMRECDERTLDLVNRSINFNLVSIASCSNPFSVIACFFLTSFL